MTKKPFSSFLAMEIANHLRDKHGINYWKKENWSVSDAQFEPEDLAKITKLSFKNILENYLIGLDKLPNLKSLSIINTSDYAFTKSDASIGNNDIVAIEKLTNLEELEIINQSKVDNIDLSQLTKLTELRINQNSNLEHIYGAEKLKSLDHLECYGNYSLNSFENLDKIIETGNLGDGIELDVMLFPSAIGYNHRDGSYNQKAYLAMPPDNTAWIEPAGDIRNSKMTKLSHEKMIELHNKACEIIDRNVPQNGNTQDIILATELYLAEHVVYDKAKLKGSKYLHKDGVSIGVKNGAQGAYNCLVGNCCVCQGYTRGERYLLGLRGIKTHEVDCLAGEDTIGMSDSKKQFYGDPTLPESGYHSIIRIDDYYGLYSDPCWNAGKYQAGDKSMPYSLRTKAEISKTHTLSFGERNSGACYKVDPQYICSSIKYNDCFKRIRQKQIEEQRNKAGFNAPVPPTFGQVMTTAEVSTYWRRNNGR